MLTDFSFKLARKLMRLAQNRPFLRPLVRIVCNILGRVLYTSENDLLRIVVTQIKGSLDHPLSFYRDEILRNEALSKLYFQRSQQFGLKKYKDWNDRVTRVIGGIAIYYAVVRELRPSVIVETGTATGSMTSFLLAALHENAHGKLISIDIPPVDEKLTMDITLPPNAVGLFIPDAYKTRWTYLAGDAKLHLPKVLISEKVDLFVHDSLHTATHMAFEYAVARALMKEKTVIVSDDILWNRSFFDFLETHHLTGYAPESNPNIGICVNRFDAFETEIGLGLQETVT